MIRPQAIGAIIFTVVGLALILGGGGYLYVMYRPVDPAVEAREAYGRGRQMLNRGAFQMALNEFNTALEIDPEFSEVHRHRGEALWRLDDHFGAIREFTRSIETGFDDAGVYLLRGQAHEALEQIAEAAADYAHVAEIDPDNRQVFPRSGRLLLQVAQYEEAASHLIEAVKRVPSDAPSYRNLGWAYWGMGRYADAIEPFTKAIEEDPYLFHGYLGRGATRVFMQQYEEALPDLEQSIVTGELQTDYAHFFLFLARRHVGQDEAAEATLRKHATQRRRMPGADWPGSIIDFFVGEMSEEELFVRVEETGTTPDPNILVEGCYYAGMMHLIEGDEDGAVALFRRAIDTEVYTFYEYHGAMAELRGLGLAE